MPSTETDSTSTTLPTLLTADDLADQLGYPKSRIYALAREGDLPVIRFGRAMRFDPNAVRKWLEAGGTAGNGSDG